MRPRPLANQAGLCQRVWLLLSLFTAVASCLAEELVLHLKNGDRLTGTLVSETAAEIVFTTPILGKLTVSANQIVRREKAQPTITPPSPTPAPSIPQSPPTPAPTAAPIPAPPPAAVPKPPDAPPPGPSALEKFFDSWKGDVQIGANLIFSTKDRQTFTGRVKLTHSGEPFHGSSQMRNVLDYNASYGRTDGVLSDNQMDGSWKVEYDIGKARRFLVYNAAGAGYNEVQRIDLRYDLGPGLGYKVLVLTNLVLKSEVGGNFQRQVFVGGLVKERFALRFAEDATWQVSKKVRFDEKIEFFPQVENFDNFRLRLEGNLSYLLRNNVTFTLSVIDLYDTGLPASVSNNDLQIRSLIGIKF